MPQMAHGEIGPLLGSGKMAEAFHYGDHVLKLYRDPQARAVAFAEAAILAIVGEHGLPTPAVHEAGHFAGRWGLVMDRVPGQPLAKLAEADPTQIPAVLEAMVQLHLAMHAREETRLSPLKPRLAARIARVPELDERLRAKLLADLARLPDGNRLCHGDFHPFNIIGTPDAAMIVDWPDATSGPPAADVARSYLLMLHGASHALADAYLDRYLALSELTDPEIRAWLPTIAAARLTENVPQENDRLLALARG
jgi:Ser/Thr protein kinase RdoA (MazF antagonist)